LVQQPIDFAIQFAFSVKLRQNISLSTKSL
jgi:hypothetical protein